MRIQFTKMQGAGNDFVVLDETRGPLGLSAAHYRFLGNRHYGVGADQILTVRPSPGEGIDFEYVIHNADGNEVEQCGNGSRCFARFVHDRGLTDKATIRVQTMKGVIAPQLNADGRVTVDMGAPQFDLPEVPFDGTGLELRVEGSWEKWVISPVDTAQVAPERVAFSVVSMGNPHAVLVVADVDTAEVERLGPVVQAHGCFPQGVNVGFLQVQDRSHVRLRVYERGVGETLACGTGACAAVVSGIRLGLVDSPVEVQARGGELTIAWAGGNAPVFMTGPAVTVFHGEIDLPEHLA